MNHHIGSCEAGPGTKRLDLGAAEFLEGGCKGVRILVAGFLANDRSDQLANPLDIGGNDTGVTTPRHFPQCGGHRRTRLRQVLDRGAFGVVHRDDEAVAGPAPVQRDTAIRRQRPHFERANLFIDNAFLAGHRLQLAQHGGELRLAASRVQDREARNGRPILHGRLRDADHDGPAQGKPDVVEDEIDLLGDIRIV